MQRNALSLLVLGAGILLGKVAEVVRREQFLLDMSEQEIRAVVANSSVLHVGGQHRGGTTLTWDGLQQHPDFSGFTVESRRSEANSARDGEDDADEDADNDAEDAVDDNEHDEVAETLRKRRLRLYPFISEFRSEGVFLQDVLPKFSLHHPWWPYVVKKFVYDCTRLLAPALSDFLRLRQGLLGLAEYGFSPASHLDETHALNSVGTALRLFRQWGRIWDLRRKVLLEKSPSNIRIARLLHALWANLGGTARFVFVSRHPIMQALAMQEGGFASESMYELVEHWVVLEEGLQVGAPHAHTTPPPRSHQSEHTCTDIAGLLPADAVHLCVCASTFMSLFASARTSGCTCEYA